MAQKLRPAGKKKPEVAVIMGSSSDAKVMRGAARLLRDWKIPFEAKVVSAHRTPGFMKKYCEEAAGREIKIIIAGAGGAAHLPGMAASFSSLPVIGVPIKSKALKGLDSLLSVAQMPKGVPVAAVAVDGAQNAALLAIRFLALENKALKKRLERFQKKQARKSLSSNSDLKKLLL